MYYIRASYLLHIIYDVLYNINTNVSLLSVAERCVRRLTHRCSSVCNHVGYVLWYHKLDREERHNHQTCTNIKLYVCVSVCVCAICLSVYPFVHLSVCLSVHLSIHLSVCPSVCPSICLSIYLSVHLSVCLSVHLSIYLSVCL